MSGGIAEKLPRPEMPKKIIYLDQNFVSDMAKAKFMGDTSRARKLGNYAALYDRLKALVDNDKVICPESVFHNYESIEATLAKAAQKVISRLSYGLCFRFPRDIIRFQAYKAAREFLGLPPEETPEWQDGFDDDPHEPVECRTFQHGKGKAIPMIPWQIHPSPDPKKYSEDRKAVGGKFMWKDLPMRVAEQKLGVIRKIYGDQVDKHSAGEARLLREAWQDLGAAKARLADFLRSDHLRDILSLTFFVL